MSQIDDFQLIIIITFLALFHRCLSLLVVVKKPSKNKKLNSKTGIELLGSPLAGPQEYFGKFMNNIISKLSLDLDELIKINDPQTNYILLRGSYSLNRIKHLLRTVPRPRCTLAYERYDQKMLGHLTRIVPLASGRDQALS